MSDYEKTSTRTSRWCCWTAWFKKQPSHSLPSEFRVNVEAGLRTALATAIAFLWMGLGPFEGVGLTFFTGVTTIVCVGNSAGQTIKRCLQMTNGAILGVICAVLPRWLMQYGRVPAGVGFFVANYLVLRSRRLTSLGKKFGCLATTIVILADISDDGLTTDWVLTALNFVRVNIEGGIFALMALLFPYPKFATWNAALRVEFMCHSLSLAVKSCVNGFIKGRDETSISRARLLCIQVRHHLVIVREELEWSRLELGLMSGGCFSGGMRVADALEEKVELMDQVLQGVRGMRQSLSNMHRTRAQSSFAKVVAPSLRNVSEAVTTSLQIISTNAAKLIGMPKSCCQPSFRFRLLRMKGENVTDNNSNNNNNHHEGRHGGERPTVAAAHERAVAGSTPDARKAELERLDEAVSRLMLDYNRARREVLYGLDDLGRPLEAQGDGEDGTDGSPPEPRDPVLFSNLKGLAKRHLPSTSLSNPVNIAPDVFSRTSVGGRKTTPDMNAGGESSELPNHVLVMQERQKLGSSATMGRGAFVFSLAGVCEELRKKRTSCSGDWRLSDSGEAAKFMLSGIWVALRPPPGLLDWFLGATRRLLCMTPTELEEDGGGVSGNGSDASSEKEKQKGMSWWDTVVKGQWIWCIKVSLVLTVCGAFRLSSFLDALFEPATWIAVTAAFVLETQSASATVTCLMRLIGTVVGAVYGIVAAKLSDQSIDEPYSYQAYAILLPYVAVSSFFRNSPTFNHAALVAAFTAVVIFTGSNTVLGADGEAVSLARIVNTVVGSIIYLLIDILIIPTRAKDLVEEKTYQALDAAFKEVSINGERLFGVGVCSRRSRRQLVKRLRSRSDSGAFSPSSLVPALAKHESSFSREGGHRDDRHAEGPSHPPKPLGETWGQPLEVLEENTTAAQKANKSRASRGVGSKSRTGRGRKGGAKVTGGEEKGEDELVVAEEGRRHSRRLSSLLEALSWSPREKHHSYLQEVITALDQQKRLMPLAQLEPQLWYAQFPTSAYHDMIAAQEELIRALSLMSRAGIAISEDHSMHWRHEMMELGTHLVSLVQLLKVGLEDARNVFGGGGPSAASPLWDSSEYGGDRHGIHLLDVQAEAIRLDSNVNADFARYIQAFIERGAFPTLEVESMLRISTTTIAIMGLQRALLKLGHAVATVLDRESFPHFYR